MIGAIADDLTGATDVAAAFRSAGLRVGLFFGGIAASAPTADLDAVVVGLKTRTVPAADAVDASLAAARARRSRAGSPTDPPATSAHGWRTACW